MVADNLNANQPPTYSPPELVPNEMVGNLGELSNKEQVGVSNDIQRAKQANPRQEETGEPQDFEDNQDNNYNGAQNEIGNNTQSGGQQQNEGTSGTYQKNFDRQEKIAYPELSDTKKGINEDLSGVMSFINRKKIKNLNKRIKDEENKLKKNKKEEKEKQKEMLPLRFSLRAALTTEMAIDIGKSITMGVGMIAGVVTVILSVIWYWTTKIFIIILFYQLLKRPAPSFLGALTGNKFSQSQKIKEKIKEKQKEIDVIKELRKKIEWNITALSHERDELTRAFKTTPGFKAATHPV